MPDNGPHATLQTRTARLNMNCAPLVRVGIACLALFIGLSLFSLSHFTSTAHAAETEEAQTPAPARSLGQMWSARSGDIEALVTEVKELRTQAKNLAKPLTTNLRQARVQFPRLTSMYQASRGHPTEQYTLVQQMHGLINSLKAQIMPLELISNTIKNRMQEITALEKDLADANSLQVDVTLNEDDEQGKMRYDKSLQDAKRAVLPTIQWLEAILNPAKAAMDRFDASLKNVDSTLVKVWEQYYLTPSDNSLDALVSTPALLTGWVTSLTSRAAFAYPQTMDEWVDECKNFFTSAFLMALLGALALRGAKVLPERWNEAVKRVIHGSWVWIAFGLSLLACSTNQYGGIYFGFVLAGSLIIIAGIAALSWRLRLTVVPELKDEPSPLARLYVVSAVGVLMLFSDLPTRILGIVWGLCIAFFMYKIVRARRTRTNKMSLPLLERLTQASAFWFALASLLVALAGYARLSILLFMVLFALSSTVLLGSAMMDLCTTLANLIFNKESKPVLNALAEALGIPLAWALSLVCTVPWIWAIPGAKYLLEHMLEQDYTVGEATFDFSKILIIVVLFFLFRSLVSLGSTSLEHLPERLPSMEKGVIPPLRTLFVYALWAVFAIICLGMVGVNFTSLAVVAGGLSVGIGFGMQNIFNNLVSGLMLIFGRTILVGDYVEVGSAAGTVKAISIRSTTLQTPERALIFVPNSAIMSSQFTNWTRGNNTVRKSLDIGVAYGSDTELVTKLLLQAAKEQPDILILPAPAVYFMNFGASSLDFRLNVFVSFDLAMGVMSQLRFRVEQLFDENGIDIPFPQLTVHVPAQEALTQGTSE